MAEKFRADNAFLGKEKSRLMDWLAYFIRWHREPWPVDYLVFDLETTGLKRDYDLPVDFGWCLVRGGEIVDHGNFVLDWTRYPDLVEPSWLEERLSHIGTKLSERGETWVYTPSYLQERGTDPLRVLRHACRLFRLNREAGAKVVGHNAWSFDCPIIENVFLEYLDDSDPFVFLDDEVYDTGGIEKASQTGLLPFKDESLRDYFSRVHSHWAPGVKWSLSYCLSKYQLLGKLPEKDSLHSAGTDVLATHLLFEELKQWAGHIT